MALIHRDEGHGARPLDVLLVTTAPVASLPGMRAQAQQHTAADDPVINVDTKKKESAPRSALPYP